MRESLGCSLGDSREHSFAVFNQNALLYNPAAPRPGLVGPIRLRQLRRRALLANHEAAVQLVPEASLRRALHGAGLARADRSGAVLGFGDRRRSGPGPGQAGEDVAEV